MDFDDDAFPLGAGDGRIRLTRRESRCSSVGWRVARAFGETLVLVWAILLVPTIATPPGPTSLHDRARLRAEARSLFLVGLSLLLALSLALGALQLVRVCARRTLESFARARFLLLMAMLLIDLALVVFQCVGVLLLALAHLAERYHDTVWPGLRSLLAGLAAVTACVALFWAAVGVRHWLSGYKCRVRCCVRCMRRRSSADRARRLIVEASWSVSEDDGTGLLQAT